MIKGSCLCGQVRYEISGRMGAITHCHCLSCQKAHAAAFSSVAAVEVENLRFAAGKSLLKFYESSPGKRRYFCSSCGSQIYSKREDQNHYIFRMGTIDGDPGVRPAQHIFTRYKAPWYNIHDDIPEFSEWAIEATDDSSTVAQIYQPLLNCVQTALGLAAKKGTATSLLMIDISGSKKEQSSERNLTDAAKRSELLDEIKHNIRDSDDVECINNRIYGVLLPYTDASAAIILAERICNTLKGLTLEIDKEINIGAATLRANQLNKATHLADEIIIMASKALSGSKKLGTNRVTHYNTLE